MCLELFTETRDPRDKVLPKAQPLLYRARVVKRPSRTLGQHELYRYALPLPAKFLEIRQVPGNPYRITQDTPRVSISFGRRVI